jgi:hypothetical protein
MAEDRISNEKLHNKLHTKMFKNVSSYKQTQPQTSNIQQINQITTNQRVETKEQKEKQ